MNYQDVRDSFDAPQAEEVELLSVVTMALWLGCLCVGGIGLFLPYARPRPPAKEALPVHAELLNVEIARNQLNEPQTPALTPEWAKAQEQPPPAPESVIAPEAPSMTAVAEPSQSIAFARPVAGPSHPATIASAAPTEIQHLTYGEGEGQQPAPEYPREATMARQQGVVVVRFAVGQDGSVQSAQAVTPCPWPLLNQAAVRAVRESWRFTAGAVRSYEVSIQFELRQPSK